MSKKNKIKNHNFEEITEIFRFASNKAATKILEIYECDELTKKIKKDKTPLTKADIESNRIIIEILKKELRSITRVSEETQIPDCMDFDEFILIDPLDGTKEFLNKNGEFTVNIALIQQNRPQIGVIDVPVQKTQYYSNGYNSFRSIQNEVQIINSSKSSELSIVCSRSHLDKKTEEFLSKINYENDLIKKGSSLKLCMIADSKANLYIRFGKTMEWDIAAGHAIIQTANANLIGFEKNNICEFLYGKKNFKNGAFIASSSTVDLDIIKEYAISLA